MWERGGRRETPIPGDLIPRTPGAITQGGGETPRPEPIPNTPNTAKQKCPNCDSIYAQIQNAEAELDKAYDAHRSAFAAYHALDGTLKRLKYKLKGAKADLAAFDNPSEYAESDGRKVDRVDIELKRQAQAEAFNKWQSGRCFFKGNRGKLGFFDAGSHRTTQKKCP